MNNKLISGLLFSLLLPFNSYADVVGVKADASYWNFKGSSKNEASAQQLPRENDLKRQGTGQLSIALEHPIPLLPNAKIKYVNLDSQSDWSQGFKSDVELSNINYILYYELLDNIVSADVGIAATHLDGEVRQTAAGLTQRYKLSDYLPTIYAQAGVKLPFTGLSLKAEGSYGRLDDIRLNDFQGELQYDFIDNLLLDVGAKVGYRIMNIDHKQDNLGDLKLEFKGPYIGLDIHF